MTTPPWPGRFGSSRACEPLDPGACPGRAAKRHGGVSSAGAVDKAELALEMQCVLGESPLWDPRTGELVWVDIARGDIFWWTPGAPSARRLPTGQTVSAIAPRASGGYVLATRSGFAQLDQAAGIELIAPVEDDRPE